MKCPNPNCNATDHIEGAKFCHRCGYPLVPKRKGNEIMRAIITRQVKEIIAEKLDVDESEVTESTNFTHDLFVDSLDIVELIMEIEKVFGFPVTDEAVNNIATVGDVINSVYEMVCKQT